MRIEQQKGFIPILILVGAFLLVSVSVVATVGVVKYKNEIKSAVANISSVVFSSKEEPAEEQKPEEETIAEATSTSDTIAELQEQIDELKEQPSTQIIYKEKEIIKEVFVPTPASELTPEPEPDLAAIIAQWRPLIAYIECYSINRTTKTGSGTLMTERDGGRIIFTNDHVISFGEYGANSCKSKFPDHSNTYESQTTFAAKSGLDWGYIRVTPDEYLRNIPYTAFFGCSIKPDIGDSVVILGYPEIGSKTDITATEGIISGYDGDYFITSAKVDRGNSGGAAILLKDNCHLGIPSFAQTGDIESLARILDFNVIYK